MKKKASSEAEKHNLMWQERGPGARPRWQGLQRRVLKLAAWSQQQRGQARMKADGVAPGGTLQPCWTFIQRAPEAPSQPSHLLTPSVLWTPSPQASSILTSGSSNPLLLSPHPTSWRCPACCPCSLRMWGCWLQLSEVQGVSTTI